MMEEITEVSLGKIRYHYNVEQLQCLTCKEVHQKIVKIDNKNTNLAKQLIYLAGIKVCINHVLCKKCANILLNACQLKYKIISQTVNNTDNAKVLEMDEIRNCGILLDEIQFKDSTAPKKKETACSILNCSRCHIYAHENESFSSRTNPCSCIKGSVRKVSVHEPAKLSFKCIYCNKAYKDYSSVATHEEKHFSKRNISKMLRSNVSSTVAKVDVRNGLPNVSHSKTSPKRHASKEKLCNKCGKIILSLSKHKCDVAKKKVSRTYTCETCGKSFMRYGTYWSHKKYSHSEEKNTYDCTFCNKVCNNANTLREHTIRNHNNGVMPYVCKICTKGFPTSSKIKRHMIIHSYEKKYRCEKCETSFSQSAKLKIHMKEFHKGSAAPKEDICQSMNLINNCFQTISIVENNDNIQEARSEKSQW